ncbi:divergent polysaccharide deacetylase family protein [Paraglaciecola marina]|uniref:divergent polysaccharide deacetylase family protein n=1 Tax=Paraglaciecola marina TaxID=2500157 RepID=UPI001EF07300|nr:divergent polysaccharide deacetylase family protein [Paraglaciecola marina]
MTITVSVQSSQIVLIIDDMGNKSQDAEAFSLPENIAFAILPNKALTKSFSEKAAIQHREVILHMPMESLGGVKQEQGVLLSNMSATDILSSLQNALDSVPNAIGLNNHMGSKFTQLSFPLSVTMEFLLDKGLFFVDSRTTRYSKAQRIAEQVGVPNIMRHVFLDHVVELKEIEIQFNRLIELSKKNGYAVGIAHPHPETLNFLKGHLPELKKQQITLSKLSDILPKYTASLPLSFKD